MLINAKFDEKDIEKEKSVVCEEINMSSDSPEEVLDDAHSKITYAGDGLRNPILGTSEKVRALDRSKIIDFVKERYKPENSVISICGKIDENNIKEEVEKYFGKWENENNYIVQSNEVKMNKESVYVKKEIEQLHINLSLKGLPYAHEKMYALVLINNILGGGASSRLFRKVREDLGLCYSIYSYLESYQKTGRYNIYVALSKECANIALEAIKEEIEKMIKEGITEEELRVNKEKIKGHYILGQESTSSKMFSNARSLLFKGKVQSEEEVMKRIDSIKMEDIKWVLENCLKDGIYNIAYVGQTIDKKMMDSIIWDSKK